jgi:hypothetical protein
MVLRVFSGRIRIIGAIVPSRSSEGGAEVKGSFRENRVQEVLRRAR